jgi:hypothetical protein
MAPGRQESENSSIVDQHAGRRGRKRRASGGSDERPPVPVSEIPRLGAQTPSRAYRRWSEQLQEVGAARTKPGKTGGVVPKVTRQNQGPPVIAEKTCDRGAPASSRRTFGGCAIKTSRGGRGQNAAPGLKIDQ